VLNELNPDMTMRPETSIIPKRFPFVHTAALEVTSKCNLKCTYCAVSQADYKGLDMPQSMLNSVLDELRTRKVEQVCINGHGETTARRGWEVPFVPLVDEFKISLISNLARRLKAQEAHFLSTIDSLNVSLDTVDADLLRKVRRGLEFDVLVANLHLVRSEADRESRIGPKLILFAGVYDLSVFGLEDLAKFAVEHHFSHVVFWSVVKHPDVPNAVNVNTLLSLDDGQKEGSLAAINSATLVLERSGVTYEFVGDFFAIYKLHCESLSNRSVETDSTGQRGDNTSEVLETLGTHENRIYSSAQVGFTKNCFDPWNYSQIKADGTVYPCCAHSPVGKVDDTNSYSDVLDGENLQTLRGSLLNGDLDNECRNCHMRSDISIPEFQASYRKIFDSNPGGEVPISVPPWLGVPASSDSGPVPQSANGYKRALRAFRRVFERVLKKRSGGNR
jgi:radical SAM protein with 4Fe4S-binding SPASM domain